ncbi:hypothetical protein FPQ18DRAFT_345063 [Pyronema domesticum]|nr:hypothetical protein FPQ18DRAFT_345063 [Pyronema domesticum]
MSFRVPLRVLVFLLLSLAEFSDWGSILVGRRLWRFGVYSCLLFLGFCIIIF